MRCKIGESSYKGYFDFGTHYMHQFPPSETAGVSFQSPCFVCSVPTCMMKNVESNNAFGLLLGKTNQVVNDFTFQAPKLTILNPPKVTTFWPPSASRGDKIHFSVDDNPEGKTRMYLHLGLFTTLECFSDGKSILKFDCMDRIPIMKPGIYHVRISYNKKILSDPTHRFIYRDRLHPYYIMPFRVSAEGGTSMKIGVFTYQIEPRAGPVSGDTQILIHGRNFAGGDNYKCKFDG